MAVTLAAMGAYFERSDTRILIAAASVLAVAFAGGPPVFWGFLAATILAGIVFLAFRFTPLFCAGWLLLTGLTLEMTLNDLVGPEAFQPTIAAIKGAQVVLACICAIRYGVRPDILCPVWAFTAMFTFGLIHGLMPGVTVSDSIRSAIGSMAPFAFCFCRLPRDWADTMIRATKWAPLTAVALGLPLAVTGIRPLFIDSGGLRLAGLGHPAFLAGICLPAIYACLIGLFREGRATDLRLLILNMIILVLTGARAPFGYALAVTAIALLSIRSQVFPNRTRLLLVAGGLSVLPVVWLASDDIRLFNIVLNDTSNLSGRGLLWPSFEAAAAQSPWFGWGSGAANAVIPPDGRIAHILHTWAAHNEYLRLQVEGGMIGVTLLFSLFVAWVTVHTRGLRPDERRIMRLAFLALAAHAITDNVLISTPACVFFAFTAAVFARTRSV